MDRRRFLQAGVFTAGGTAAIPLLTTAAGAQSAGTSPYGSIEGNTPDENGMILPEGFTSRIVAVAGEPVGDTDFEWHIFPDGAATFAQDDGGWIHTVNSEVFVAGAAGVSAIRYDADGNIVDAYEVLRGSIANCGGGPTPWGTFLSGEEDFGGGLGVMWECDPTGESDPVAREAMGRFIHEAAAVDPVRQHVYQTEDMPDGRLYRFTPDSYPDLSAGLLEVATVAADGSVTWTEVPDPTGAETPTRQQVPESTAFLGGEGIWYFEDWIFFSTKFDNNIHGVDLANLTHTILYAANPDDVADGTAVLSGVDNLTVDHGSGDIFVAEDGGNMEVVIITPDGEVAPFARIVDQEQSEITGPVFNPARDRLYFSSQRGPSPRTIVDINPMMQSEDNFGGITYEVTGPFRGIVEPPPETTTTTEAPPDSTTTAAATETTTTPAPTTTLAAVDADSGGDDDSNTGLVIGAGAGAAILVAAGAIGLRRRAQG
jgi:secreted PhoX family phosphatase